ncbi:hypothetical protein D6D54_07855 [Spiroplasma poulsonii]|uniref:Uncharacterized protein n=2 Tax=Spiroplasma poulsonii TaxID=2138 RepID=A0A433EN80_9MOLU|nr:hypothetical protein D6D54_07855 [Spiroplasma poulsonii]
MNIIEKIKNRRNESRQNMMKKAENKDTKNHNLMIVDVDLQKCLNCSFTIQKVMMMSDLQLIREIKTAVNYNFVL